jgi:hypothetical protein
MKHSIINTLGRTNSKEYSVTQNYCPLPSKNVDNTVGLQDELNEEAQKLLFRYWELVTEINKIRGKLYKNGINPDKYSK